jgi:hypothetical protein
MANVYRLAVGTLTVAALQANSAYIVENFTKSGSETWYVQTNGLIQPGTRRTVSLTGQVTNYGNYTLPPWQFLISKSQADYLDTSIFGGLPSVAVTIQTFDVYRDTWRCFNCTMVQPDLSTDDANQVNDYWFNLATYRFINATLAAAS